MPNQIVIRFRGAIRSRRRGRRMRTHPRHISTLPRRRPPSPGQSALGHDVGDDRIVRRDQHPNAIGGSPGMGLRWHPHGHWPGPGAPRPGTDVIPVLSLVRYRPSYGPATRAAAPAATGATLATGHRGTSQERARALATACCPCCHWPRPGRHRLRGRLAQRWRRKARRDDHNRGAGWRNGRWRPVLERGPPQVLQVHALSRRGELPRPGRVRQRH